jgi:hypothetical protein
MFYIMTYFISLKNILQFLTKLDSYCKFYEMHETQIFSINAMDVINIFTKECEQIIKLVKKRYIFYYNYHICCHYMCYYRCYKCCWRHMWYYKYVVGGIWISNIYAGAFVLMIPKIIICYKHQNAIHNKNTQYNNYLHQYGLIQKYFVILHLKYFIISVVLFYYVK